METNDRKTILQWVLANIPLIVEAVLFIAMIMMMSKCNRDNIFDLEQNINAYKNHIEVVETKNGELMTINESLILKEKEIREELKMTKKEYRDIEKQLEGSIAYIAQLKSEVDMKDTIWMKPDTVYINNDITFKHFSWTDQWNTIDATLSGLTISDSRLSINSLNIRVPLEVGLSDDYKIWVKSENPNVEFTDIKGSVVQNSSIDDRKRRFGHGFHIGFGFQYGLFGRTFDFGPQVGYSLQFNF